jgi:hypothetical protein
MASNSQNLARKTEQHGKRARCDGSSEVLVGDDYTPTEQAGGDALTCTIPQFVVNNLDIESTDELAIYLDTERDQMILSKNTDE